MIKQSQVDAHDFTLLYEREAPRLWRAMLAFTGDRELANDAVAEAFAQCLRRGDEVRVPIRWIWKAAYRIASRGLHGDPLRHQVTDELTSITPETPDLDLLAALRRLSERQRATVVLHYYAGYSTVDVAAILGISPATVRVHLMQGRKRLRELLGDDDG